MLSPTPTTVEIFEHVTAHLLKQGARSVIAVAFVTNDCPAGSCAYRGAGGTRCAVGCLIPDALYSELYEGQLAEKLSAVRPSPFGWTATPGQVKLLTRLQRLHDSSDPAAWKTALHAVKRELDAGDFND